MEPRTPSARVLIALSLLFSLSCASGVGDSDSELDDLDSAVNVDPEDGEGDEDADTGEDDGWIAEPMLPESGPGAPRDGGGAQNSADTGARDAGGDAASGGSRDAGSDAGARDAGLDASNAPRDAGASAADAGRDSGAQRDSGTPGGGTPGGGTPGGGANCNPANCEGCSVVGPFPCCRENNTCGCTWAPGGYCL